MTARPDFDTAFLLRYVRLLRFAWLNPSCAEAQAAMHAFEKTHPDQVDACTEALKGRPLLDEAELRWAMQNLNYFARPCPAGWKRASESDADARKMLGGPR